ncbi:dicarboxylate/amino acid:cation symporter [Anaeromyxobacter paludicola]|uniref:C4-dicarboxylate ABC transporter n=1 Tax=Anaeromyxobacter paludicola TaxID=2918171 RepID=A0ABN6N9C1_9BACT|nr:cation:dicarboxylase symporter family transporter [Anaeromyxobacter paludicola]BDG09833.1 C4-dicarboxylate ABC transporter [Anaeromyxobacter paludicola]
MPAASAPRRKLSLTHQIAIGLAAGVLLGWLCPGFAVQLRPVGQLFLRLIKMIVGPLVLTSLVAGLAGAGGKMAGRLGLKALLWFEAATTVALFIGLAGAHLVHPGAGVGLAADAATAGKLAHAKGAVDFLLEAFPTSIFDALARNDVLQIVVFGVFLGLGIAAAGEKAARLRELAEQGAEAMFKVVGFVMRFAPFGVGAAMASTLGAKGLGVLLPLAKVIGTLYGSLLVFFAALFLAVRLLTRVRVSALLAAIREPAIVAFTTTSSEAAMPRAMEAMERLGVPRAVVAFVMPAGYSFNLDGSTLYLSVAVMFVAQAAGVHLSLVEQLAIMGTLMLTTKGVAGVPRSALVVLAGALTAFHLPLEGVAILLAIDELMDMGRSCVNVVGNCVATAVVACWEGVVPAGAPLLRAPRLAAANAPEAPARDRASGE